MDIVSEQQTGHSDSVRLQHVLKSAPPSLWLETIRRTKPDRHAELIHWILAQPECDFAVAAYAFYRSDPVSQLIAPKPLPSRPDVSDVFSHVLLNWDMGFYRTHEVRLDDTDIDQRQITRLKQKLLAWPKGALPFRIPERLIEISGGDPIGLQLQFSPDHSSRLRPLYESLGLQVTAPRQRLHQNLAAIAKQFGRITARGVRS